MPRPQIETRLRIAGLLVAAGLILQFLTIFWNHPLAFLLFLGVGIPITLAGVLIYLVSLLTASRGNPSS
jgi:hypothetical protein